MVVGAVSGVHALPDGAAAVVVPPRPQYSVLPPMGLPRPERGRRRSRCRGGLLSPIAGAPELPDAGLPELPGRDARAPDAGAGVLALFSAGNGVPELPLAAGSEVPLAARGRRGRSSNGRRRLRCNPGIAPVTGADE